MTESMRIEIRPQVQAFAEAMEEVLRKNDHKGGWENCEIDYLNWRLTQEFGGYFANYDKMTPEQKRKELVDISNFCMMLWDRT